ncbi:hypothetical protein NMS00_001871 [Vibrio alginolyticus]|nr:hypothetical protein [Vibrio alginolyticus]
MEGYIQTGLGILVSLILFVVGYRQTIGAKKERAKNANSSILRAVMRRMVLEDYVPIYKDISRIVEGKAREFQVSSNDLLSEEQVLNSLFTEVFDSDLISPTQRTEIETRISSVLNEAEQEPSKATISEFQQLKFEKQSKKESLTAMALSASVLGALTSAMYSFFETGAFESDLLLSSIGVLIGSVAVITALTTYRRSKEVDTVSSRATAVITASKLESDISKILEKNNMKFSIEPNLGRFRPDFLVNLNGKRVALEAKSWSRPVPFHLLRKTMDYLEMLVSTDKVDSAILVTQKKDTIPKAIIENEKITVTSVGELSNTLKNVA